MTSIIRTQQFCYLSTPQHLKSFVGKFIYLYTGHGSLSLSPTSLAFTSKTKSIDIALDSINYIRLGQYCRLTKLVPLKYIEVNYGAQGKEETVLLTPTNSWITPVWQANKIAEEWMTLLQPSQ